MRLIILTLMQFFHIKRVIMDINLSILFFRNIIELLLTFHCSQTSVVRKIIYNNLKNVEVKLYFDIILYFLKIQINYLMN